MHDCSVCMKTYHPSKRVARILPCGHDFCGPCLENLHGEGQITCPDCRTQHNIKSVDTFPVSYTLMAQQEHQGRRRRKVETMKEDQTACLLSALNDAREKIETLVKYRSTVDDISVHLDELVDVFHAMVKVTKHARRGLTVEAEQVTKASNTGEEMSKEIDKILMKLSEATTPEQILEAVDQGDSQIEAIEVWIKTCESAHPDESTIHLATKVRDVFTKGLRYMGRHIQDLQPPLVAETLCSLSDFMAQDDPTQEYGTQDDLGHADGGQDDLRQDYGAQGDLVQVDVQSLQCGRDQVEELLTAGSPVFAMYHSDDGPRYARVSRYQHQTAYMQEDQDHLCVYYLHDQPLPTHNYIVPYSELAPAEDTGHLVFLDLTWHFRSARVIIRLQPKNLHAQQFFLLVTGQRGPCYADTCLGGILLEDIRYNSRCVWGGNWDGREGKAIVPGLRDAQCQGQRLEGVVAGWGDSARFGILTNYMDGYLNYVFGEVESGLDVLQEVAKLCNDGVKNVTITDCGVMMPC